MSDSRLPESSSLPPLICQLQLFPYAPQLTPVILMHFLQQRRMLLLQLDKFLFKLLVPWVENEDLETERRRSNDKVCQRKGFCYHHFKVPKNLGPV